MVSNYFIIHKVERKLTKILTEWKNDPQRQPLVLLGARQVGKTYILKDFGTRHYKNLVYLNFEQNFDLKSIFENELSPETIIRLIEVATKQTVVPESTLVFFDEIQVCGRALTSLKYFDEYATRFHIVAAGSLLGVAVNDDKYSFPVGKVMLQTLSPFDFEEFLWALESRALAEEIRICYQHNKPLVEILHKQALELYRTYMCTGGMPAVVAEYAASLKFTGLDEIKNNILNGYLADMSKYASAAESIKIRMAFDSIPAQLAKENHKFQYKVIKKGASSSYFGVAVDWLLNCNLVLKCKRAEHGKIPLASYSDLSAFKIYMQDTGLLMTKSGISAESVLIANNKFDGFKGALTENYVAQSLNFNNLDLYYWESRSRAEIDFVTTISGDVIPIEVKSSLNTRSRSLPVYVSAYSPPYSIRISEKNFGFENGIRSIPLYAVFLIS
ncbi:MAG: ATP-binding protein [Oligoflexia bacterium]|nr:ATP-binding protein [Oligoflexia bacterium]